MEFIKKHFDFKFDIFSIICLLIFVLSFLLYKKLPIQFGYENGVLENIQMIVLFGGCFFCLKIKNINYKKFFILCFLILTIIMLREINCGRTIFFPIEGVENAFYSWKDIPYGYLAHPIYGLYMGLVGLYFILNKLWKELFSLLTEYKIPVFNIIFLIIGMIYGMICEKHFHNDILEEFGELLFYIALFGIIYIYSRNKVSFIQVSKSKTSKQKI